ncbi:MAG: 2-C-methyl-D-erythritol 4-phosphate cytidylyltransferase [Flammeovirgaceae bacterium]
MFQEVPLYVIVVAGGKGSRMGTDVPKQFIPIAGKPILMRTLEQFYKVVPSASLIVVLPSFQVDYWKNLVNQYNFQVSHKIALGGQERFHSVQNGLDLIQNDGLVAIHDGVRPFVSEEVIIKSFEDAFKFGNAITSVLPKDSIRVINNDISQSVDRKMYRLIQTPQTFKVNLIKKAFQQPYQPLFTDDASVLEAMGETIHLIEGNYENIKITTKEDLKIAEVFAENK